MPTIDLERYPRIAQIHPLGCIPVNIANTLKYFNEFNYDERTLFEFYQDNHIPFCFDQALPYLENLLTHFELIFKGRSEFEDSIGNMIEHLKDNIDKQIPVLVSFEAQGGAHIGTLIEYTDTEFIFFDPGDC